MRFTIARFSHTMPLMKRKRIGVVIAFTAVAMAACAGGGDEKTAGPRSAEVHVVATDSVRTGTDPNVNADASPTVTPTPLRAVDLEPLKRFAESYEPRSGREVIPSPPALDERLSGLIAAAAQTGSRDHERYVLLIFLKLYRFHVENFSQSYALGRGTPLTTEFYRLIGEADEPDAEPVRSSAVATYIKDHPELLEYEPIRREMERIEKAEESIKRRALRN